MISVYVDDFLLASKYKHCMDWIKNKFKNEYNIKEMGEIKMIIGCQVTQNLETRTLKVDQSAFICDLLKEKNLMDCNLVNITMKAGSIIEMNKVDDYDETNFKAY